MAVKSSKYSHQSSSTSENAVKSIETSVTTSDYVLPERFGCQVDSESTAPSRIVGCAAHVPSQSEKRSDDHNVRVRLRTRRSRAELMLKSETVNSEHVRGEMAKLNPSKTTETSLDSTNRDDERRTARKQSQRNAFTNFTGVPRESKKIGEGADDREQEEVHLKVPHPKVRRNARQFRVLGSFFATHDNVPRKIQATDQSKRD